MRYFIVFMICIFLIINDNKYVFRCLLASVYLLWENVSSSKTSVGIHTVGICSQKWNFCTIWQLFAGHFEELEKRFPKCYSEVKVFVETGPGARQESAQHPRWRDTTRLRFERLHPEKDQLPLFSNSGTLVLAHAACCWPQSSFWSCMCCCVAVAWPVTWAWSFCTDWWEEDGAWQQDILVVGCMIRDKRVGLIRGSWGEQRTPIRFLSLKYLAKMTWGPDWDILGSERATLLT